MLSKNQNTFLKSSPWMLLVFFSLLLHLNGKAQVSEISVQGGYVSSTLIPEENLVNDDLVIRQGRAKGGYTIGMSYSISPPKNQQKKGFNLNGSILFEANVTRSNASLSEASTLINGGKSLNFVNYTFYRGEYQAKLVLKLSRLMVMVGPTVSNLFYAGYQIGDEESVSASGDFSAFGVGYEYGFGLDLDRATLSVRFQEQVTDFGKNYRRKPAVLDYRQVRFILSYRLYRKHKGLNWDSIIWD